MIKLWETRKKMMLITVIWSEAIMSPIIKELLMTSLNSRKKNWLMIMKIKMNFYKKKKTLIITWKKRNRNYPKNSHSNLDSNKLKPLFLKTTWVNYWRTLTNSIKKLIKCPLDSKNLSTLLPKTWTSKTTPNPKMWITFKTCTTLWTNSNNLCQPCPNDSKNKSKNIRTTQRNSNFSLDSSRVEFRSLKNPPRLQMPRRK